MKKDVFLYYNLKYDSAQLYKFRNADLRNPNITINYMQYAGDNQWQEFLPSYIRAFNKVLSDNRIVLSDDYKGYILMYFDTLLNKTIIVTDTDKILEKISE